jgi:L-alanine-DL-glutamate epimerase-like enolase superfamily enzyme
LGNGAVDGWQSDPIGTGGICESVKISRLASWFGVQVVVRVLLLLAVFGALGGVYEHEPAR